jgi:hypothetical protein
MDPYARFIDHIMKVAGTCTVTKSELSCDERVEKMARTIIKMIEIREDKELWEDFDREDAPLEYG